MPKENEGKKKLISIRVTESQYRELKKIAEEQGVPISTVIMDNRLNRNPSARSMTKSSVACIKNISEGVRELRDDYNRIQRYRSEEAFNYAADQITYIEEEIKKLWQSLR